MQVYRICEPRFSDDAFSGIGGEQASARWNHKGVRIVYCASSRALAALEMLVHVGRQGARKTWHCCPAEVPHELIEDPADLGPVPDQWATRETWSRDTGTDWIQEKRSLALRLPSAVIPEETNVLLNPQHPAFNQVEQFPVEAFRRLLDTCPPPEPSINTNEGGSRRNSGVARFTS